MATYVNKTNKQRQIRFEDGSSKFLRRGEKVNVTKKIKRIDSGVTEVKSEPKKNTDKEMKENE